jgi:serine phosphatase RsbU (regulator of sigma subunit)
MSLTSSAGRDAYDVRQDERGERHDTRELAANASAHLYRSLFSAMDEGFALCEVVRDGSGHPVDCRILDVNHAFSVQLQLPPGEPAIGRSCSEIMSPLGHAAMTDIGMALETQTITCVDYHDQAGGGRFRCWVIPRDADHFAALIEDVTERKRREADAALLAWIADELGEMRALNLTMQAVCERVGRHFGAARVMFNEIGPPPDETSTVRYEWRREGLPSLAGVRRVAEFYSEEFVKANRAGEWTVVCDSGSDPRTTASFNAEHGTSGSLVTMPLLRGGRWTYTFAISDIKPRQWRDEEVELMHEVVRRVWNRIERACAEEALVRSERKYRTLIDTMNEGFALCELVRDESGKPVDYRILQVNAAHEAITGLTPDECVGRRSTEISAGVPLGEWLEFYAGVVESGVPQRRDIYNASLDAHFMVWAYPNAGDRFVTLFDDVSERVRAEQELQRSRRRYQTLYEASSALAQSMELTRVLDALADSVLRCVPHSRVSIALREEFGLQILTSRGDRPTHGSSLMWSKMSPALRSVIEDGQARLVDYENLPDAERGYAMEHGSRASLWVPISRGDAVIGAIGVDDVGERREFDAEQLELVSAIAAQAAVAIENARLFESERAAQSAAMRELANTQLLEAVAEAAASSTSLEELSGAVLRAINASPTHPPGAIYAYDESSADLALLAAEGMPPHALERLRGASTQTDTYALALKSVLEKRVVTDSDFAPDEREGAPLARVEGLGERRIAIPIEWQGVVLGALAFAFEREEQFLADEIGLYTSVARILSQAFENARLFEAEHEIAETLQETLVVLPDHLPDVRFSRAYASATSEAGRVGGDFVDIFEVRRHQIGIVIGDVSGKGLDAAVITSLARNTVRAHAIDGLSPGAVCQKTNNVLRRFTEVEAFVTMFFGLLDTGTGLLRYVSAGHPPGLILSRDGQAEELQGNCPFVGAFEDAEYHEWLAVLGKGERLVLYTDGVIEARAPGQGAFLNLDGFKELLRNRAAEGSASLAEALLGDVLEFSGGVLRDDAAVLTIEPVRLRPKSATQARLEFAE